MSFDTAFTKLNDMLSKRFDVNLTFVTAESKAASDVVTYETVRRNAGAPLIVTRNSMVIPLRIEGSLAGAIRVSEISHLNHVDLCRIKETIDLVMIDGMVVRSLESNVLPFKLATAN